MNLELELNPTAPAETYEEPTSTTPVVLAEPERRLLFNDCGDGYYPLTPDEFPNIDHVVTEDGQAVDGIFYAANRSLLSDPLYTSWIGPSNGRPFVAYRNVGVFISPNLPPLVPDVLLSLGVRSPSRLREKINNTYFSWVYGKMPDVAIEIVSNHEGGEYTRKFVGYAEFGIPYYIVFDPSNRLKRGVLQAFRLCGKTYQPIDPAWIEEIELGVVLWHGSYQGCEDTWLRWRDREGNLIPTGIERSERELLLRIEAERKTLEYKQQATSAVEELQRLRERMKALGLELPS